MVAGVAFRFWGWGCCCVWFGWGRGVRPWSSTGRGTGRLTYGRGRVAVELGHRSSSAVGCACVCLWGAVRRGHSDHGGVLPREDRYRPYRLGILSAREGTCGNSTRRWPRSRIQGTGPGTTRRCPGGVRRRVRTAIKAFPTAGLFTREPRNGTYRFRNLRTGESTGGNRRRRWAYGGVLRDDSSASGRRPRGVRGATRDFPFFGARRGCDVVCLGIPSPDRWVRGSTIPELLSPPPLRKN